ERRTIIELIRIGVRALLRAQLELDHGGPPGPPRRRRRKENFGRAQLRIPATILGDDMLRLDVDVQCRKQSLGQLVPRQLVNTWISAMESTRLIERVADDHRNVRRLLGGSEEHTSELQSREK